MQLSMRDTQKLKDAYGDKQCTHQQIIKERVPMWQHSYYACVIWGVLEIPCQFDKILSRTDNERKSRKTFKSKG